MGRPQIDQRDAFEIIFKLHIKGRSFKKIGATFERSGGWASNLFYDFLEEISFNNGSNKKLGWNGNLLRSLREVSQKKQWEMAREFGVSRQLVGHWETEYRIPKIPELCKIAKMFNVSTDYLLGVKK
jgi:DNA-binding XRE family transcriptional regulator